LATTSIWAVKGWLGKVVIYVENPDKTSNPEFFQNDKLTDTDRAGLADVIEYASRKDKTAMQKFVSGVNCSPETARQEMLLTKSLYDKKGGRVAFHGYQSFAMGEVDAKTAHEIGIRLAKKLWGGEFQVIVATHVDKTNHLHNHFVLNSVSFMDGHRFHNSKEDYRAMRNASDILCREYGLSVIEKPTTGKTKHYAEWSAEKNGKPTWRSHIKRDVDVAIEASMTDTQMYAYLKQKGYEIKIGKDISVRPPGKERFLRLARNFGDDYTKEAIKERILSQRSPLRAPPESISNRRIRYRHIMPKKKRRKVSGIFGLYLHYQYLLGNLPKKKRNSNKRIHFLFREDIIKLNRINEETKLLCRNHIETVEQLFSFREDKLSQIEMLTYERSGIRKKLRLQKYADVHDELSEEAAEISEKLKDLRKEVRLADGVSERSGVIKEKIKMVSELEKRRKENKRDGRIISSR